MIAFEPLKKKYNGHQKTLKTYKMRLSFNATWFNVKCIVLDERNSIIK